MSDRFCARISIGGNVKRSLIPALIKKINAEGTTLEYGGRIISIVNENHLLSCIDDFGFLTFNDEAIPNGEFENLERFLVRNKIHFTRESEAYAEYQAETVEYRGKGKPVCLTNVPLSEIKKAIDMLESKDNKENRKGIKFLKTFCPEVSELQPFEIVEN
jgi:hypothetical protein